MKENQPEILCVNGEDLSIGKKGVLGSNGIVLESNNEGDEPGKALPQLEQDPLSDHSFASIENKSQVSPPQYHDDDEKEPVHVIAQELDEEVALVFLLASDEESKCHNPITDLCVGEVAETGKEPFGGDELIDHKPHEAKILEGHNAVSRDESCNGEEDNKTKANRSILSDQKPCQNKILEGQNAASRDKSCNGEEDNKTEPSPSILNDQEPCKDKILEGQNADESCNGEEDNKTKANRSILSLQDHFADGEASFSALGFAGSPHLASVPHSGNTSLRSDSSTTSARSFAFPVLQPEWISSPVRMKKSYNRFWKHGGWWRRLRCCKF